MIKQGMWQCFLQKTTKVTQGGIVNESTIKLEPHMEEINIVVEEQYHVEIEKEQINKEQAITSTTHHKL
jgi:hypothetical protein